MYNKAAIWFISAVWLVLSWLIAFATNSGMVAVCTPVMVLPIINATMFVVKVSVVLVSSSSANTLYILWDCSVYPCCLAVFQSCCVSEGISSVPSVLGCFPKFVFDANLFSYFKLARAHNY